MADAVRKPPNAGKGRVKGVPNKATANAREAIAKFVDQGADEALRWMAEIYETDGPLAAFRCWLDLIEYHVPKLSRADVNAKVDASERLIELIYRGVKPQPPEVPK